MDTLVNAISDTHLDDTQDDEGYVVGSSLRPLVKFPTPFSPPPLSLRGATGEFWMLRAGDLHVDDGYQREISSNKGRNNVIKIFRNFSWHKFTPNIVVPVEGTEDKFAIIDGQHRSTAALMVYGQEVLLPSYLFRISFKEAADAFAAINGQITSVSQFQMFKAKIASGDLEAVETDRVLRSMGVIMIETKAPGVPWRRGESMAISTLHKLRTFYGTKIMRRALACIVYTGNGNPGLVLAPLVRAFCAIFFDNPALLENDPALLKGVNLIDLRQLVDNAYTEARRGLDDRFKVMKRMLLEEFSAVFVVKEVPND